MEKKKSKKFRCFSCQELFDMSELRRGDGLASEWWYCEHCYDHMFVSWNDVFKKNNENSNIRKLT